MPAADELCRGVVDVVRRAGYAEQGAAIDAALDAAAPGRASTRTTAAARDVADRYLAAALDDGDAGPARQLVRAVRDVAADLCWSQTAGYVAAPPHDRFLARYAHATVLGSAASTPLLVDATHTAAVGVLLLGPENHYPHHHHPADELYVPMTDALWSSGLHEPYRPLPPGRVLHHGPEQVHAVRTGPGSLLTIYVWTGDTLTPARLC